MKRYIVDPTSPGALLYLVALVFCSARPAAYGQASVPELELDENGIPPGHTILEGDMIVPVGGIAAIYETNLWPEGNPTVVPFRFDSVGLGTVIEDATCPATGTCNQTGMLNAMAVWEAVADVDFQECDPCEGAFIHIRDSTFDTNPSNNSQVGMTGDQQTLNIVSWGARFIIVHELGHALGLRHEQSRVDRAIACNGACIQINDDNISQTDCAGGPCNHNFQLREEAGHYGPYDFDALMHYDECAFTACGCCPNCPPPVPPSTTCATGGRTITVLAPVPPGVVVGQRDHLSFLDTHTMSFLYPRDNWVFADVTYDGLWKSGTFFEPFDSFSEGYVEMAQGGTLWLLHGGDYTSGGVLDKRGVIRAPLGGAMLLP